MSLIVRRLFSKSYPYIQTLYLCPELCVRCRTKVGPNMQQNVLSVCYANQIACFDLDTSTVVAPFENFFFLHHEPKTYR